MDKEKKYLERELLEEEYKLGEEYYDKILKESKEEEIKKYK